MVDNLITYLSFLVGVIGLAYAFFQGHERKKLNEIIRANNWFNFQRMQNTSGTIQLVKKLYKEKHQDNYDVEIIDWLAMADAHGQELVKETIRQIQFTEHSFRLKDFDRWLKEGKLTEDKVKLFKQFSTDIGPNET